MSAQMKDESGRAIDIDAVLDLAVTAHVELGRFSIAPESLLALKEGEVIETEVEVGQSLRIMVNDSVIATGEVVITDTGYGLRLDRIISPAERRIP